MFLIQSNFLIEKKLIKTFLFSILTFTCCWFNLNRILFEHLNFGYNLQQFKKAKMNKQYLPEVWTVWLSLPTQPLDPVHSSQWLRSSVEGRTSSIKVWAVWNKLNIFQKNSSQFSVGVSKRIIWIPIYLIIITGKNKSYKSSSNIKRYYFVQLR